MSTTETTQSAQAPAEKRVASLPEVITHLLRENNVAAPHAWAAGIHPDAMHESPKVQMFQCARQWSAILSLSKEDTRFARYCLTSAPTVKVWLTSFTTLVIPLYLKILADYAQSQKAQAPSTDHASAEVADL